MMDPASVAGEAYAGQMTGALSAAMRENQSWLAATQEAEALQAGDLPQTESLRIGIDGAGFLALDDRGARVFARASGIRLAPDGRLLDDRGRALLGYPAGPSQGAAARGPEPLGVKREDAGRFGRCDVDDTGRVWGIVREAPRKGALDQRVELGTLALAVFASPQHLRGAPDRLAANPSSGAPTYLPANAPHLGKVRRNPPYQPPDAVRANLLVLWALSGRAEIEIALASSADALTRTALNLVR